MGKIPPERYLNLWAKMDEESGLVHPLICHMVDSGNVFAAIWDQVLTRPIKRQFCVLLGLDEEHTRKTLQLLTALHDIGKAGPAFQSLSDKTRISLEGQSLIFPPNNLYIPQRHDLVTYWAFQDLCLSNGFLSREDANLVAAVLGSHHGFFYSALEIGSPHRIRNLAGEDWADIRQRLFLKLKRLIHPSDQVILQGDLGEKQSALVLLAGLVVAADWLSSDENFFPFQANLDLSLVDYAQLSRERAERAIRSIGWDAWQPEGNFPAFGHIFGFDQPSPVQRAVLESIDRIRPPFLAILEAPTGQGKTEAAFFLADRAIQSSFLRGLYIAMPTMATSNQMFDRAVDFLEKRYPSCPVNVQLAHSQALWDGGAKNFTPRLIGQDQPDEEHVINAVSWFLPKKKTLLAPFGVGTVDQALMAILRTKHFFLRLFGLSHKVVVFDEVHAYDVYMNELFIRLLYWLKRLGCSVIILSATLPEKSKQAIADVFTPGKPLADSRMYPSLTLLEPRSVSTVKIEDSISQKYRLGKIGGAPQDIIDCLSENLSDGGCAAVVCNTVKRAQVVYQSLLDSGVLNCQSKNEELILFHARFPYFWRQDIEKRVLGFFSKDGHRPKKAVLVATQVVEQSLDLDFDLLISDLAPIDLLIQRAGRLHRHTVRFRPPLLREPLLFYAVGGGDGDLDFQGSEFVYDEDVLLSTFFVLQNRPFLSLPAETRELIECVYDPFAGGVFSDEQKNRIAELHEKSRLKHENEMRIARGKLIPLADDEEILRMGRLHLEEDSPEIHRAFQALTRLIPPSVSLVCLEGREGSWLALDGRTVIDPEKASDRDRSRILLQSSLNISHWAVINHFRENVVRPNVWRKNAALRHSYPAVFDNGLYRLNDQYSLLLDRELGLQIKEEI